MIAAIMKWYSNINDAHFFVSLESSCFWICFSRAHTPVARLDDSAFILIPFQVLIPLQFQVCHLKLRLHRSPQLGNLPFTKTVIFWLIPAFLAIKAAHSLVEEMIVLFAAVSH